MPRQPLSPTILQQLHGAITSALATLTEPGVSVLGERRDVAALAMRLAIREASGHEVKIDETPWLDAALRLALAVVQSYAGTVESFESSSVLFFFGVPFAHEDDAERAALAALAIRQALEPLNERLRSQHGLSLVLSVGLHIGSVIQAQIGFGEAGHTVIGDTAARAQLLRGFADNGAMVASAAFYERTRHRFTYRDFLPPAGEPAQTAYHLLDAVVPTVTSGAQQQGLIIGRAAEREALLAVLRDVTRAPCALVALISGDAGIGKSRLVAELKTAAARKAVHYCAIRCSAFNRVKPLVLVADLLRTLFDLTADQPVMARRERLRQELSRLQLGDDLLPYIEHVLGISQSAATRHHSLSALDPVMLQRQTHLALRQVVLAAARTTPLVLVLEDLQWIDPASRDFFEYLIQTTRAGHDARLIFVLVTRDQGPESAIQPMLAAAARDPLGLLDLPLSPLSPADSRTLVAQVLRSENEPQTVLYGQIAARAAGNPLYIEELVRMLLEQGVLPPTEASWTSPYQAQRVLQHVPDTLQGLLIARFSALPARLRRVLQRAAVLGPLLPLRMLNKLEPGPLAQLNDELDELGARQFLTCEPGEADKRYIFQSAMLQEAIYQTLLLPDRQRLHNQAAEAIVEDTLLSEDERIQLLAHHYAESTAPSRALPYLVELADRSARHYANETAIQHYRRALSLLSESAEDQETLSAVRIGLGRALKFSGQYAEAAQLLSAGVDALRGASSSLGDTALQVAEVLRELAETHQRDGNLPQAVATIDEGLALLESSPSPASKRQRRTLLERLAAVRFRQGELEAAYQLATEATTMLSAEDEEDPVTLASLFNTLGGVLWQRGDLIRAHQSVEQSLRLYQRVDYAWGMATAYTNLGILNHALGHWRQAADYFQRSDMLRKEIGYLPERALNLKNLGVLQLEMGLHAEARQSLELSLAMSRSIGDHYGIVIATLQLADLALLEQHTATARAFLGEADTLLAAAGEDERILFRWLSGLVEEAEGRHERARELVSEALELAVTAGVPELEIDCRRILGSLESKGGRVAVAEHELQRALTLSVEQGSAFREGLAYYELGWHHLRLACQQLPAHPSDKEHARLFYERALERFITLDAKHEIQRTRSALKLLQ